MKYRDGECERLKLPPTGNGNSFKEPNPVPSGALSPMPSAPMGDASSKRSPPESAGLLWGP